MVLRFRVFAFGPALLGLMPGCDGPIESPKTDHAASTVSTDEILDRCVAAFARLQTLQARGVLRDNRRDDRRVRSIAWEFARPGNCRLRIEDQHSIIIGSAWWNYDSESKQFRRRKSFTRTPIETSAYLLSDRVSFLLPALWERGESAFGKSRTRGYADWRLLGAAWIHEHPCYVVARAMPSRDRPSTLRVWIDQDSFLLRCWDIIEPGDDGRDNVIVGATYREVIGNARIPEDTFRVDISPRTQRDEQPMNNEAGGADDRK